MRLETRPVTTAVLLFIQKQGATGYHVELQVTCAEQAGCALALMGLGVYNLVWAVNVKVTATDSCAVVLWFHEEAMGKMR